MAVRTLLISFLIIFFNYVICYNDTAALNKNVGIFGGHGINIKEVPYMASLRIDGKHHFCGASIIHEQFILTAAHCIIPNRYYKISVGSDDIKYGGSLYETTKIIVHEKYNETTHDYDICLIKLNETLSFGDKVNKIEIAETTPRKGVIVQATGWGSTPNRKLSERLMQVSIPVVSLRDCQLIYIKYKQRITGRMLCAGEVGRDSCEADSGGPLTFKNKQVGVISFGMTICGVKPGVYTKIKPLRKWIQETMQVNL